MEPGHAIRIGDTVYRADQLTWVKVRRLNRSEGVTRGALLGAGIAFIAAVCLAKGTLLNPEWLLGLAPVGLALSQRGQFRLASTGDDQELYEERRLEGAARPSELADRLGGDAEALRYHSPAHAYFYAFHPGRIAWARDWSEVDYGPLWLVALFGAYLALVGIGPIGQEIPLLRDLHLLDFPALGPTLPRLTAILSGLTGLGAVLTSFREGVEIAGSTGVRDTFPLSPEHRAQLLADLSQAVPPPTP